MVSLKIELGKKNITWIVLLAVALVVGVVYALTPGVAPNQGHLITQIAPPSGCANGQVLGWSGSSWGCVDMESGGISACSDCDSRYYTKGEVDILISAIETGGTACPDGFFLFELGNSYICLVDGAQITSDCCYNYGSNECVADPDWCGDAVPGSFSESKYCAPVTYSDSYGTWNLHTWARNNGGILQTRSQIVVVGSSKQPYCDSGWVNGNSQCSYWEITAYATVSSSGLQGKLMQGSTTRCSKSISW